MTKKVLVLRTSDSNRRSQGGFQWPEQGLVEAPDWDPIPICGNGLHGALWGEGDGTLFDWSDDATWQVVEVDPDLIVDLKGKVKFPWGTVVYSGDRKGATEMILAHPGGMDRVVIGANVSAGDENMIWVGDWGTATVGDKGTAIVGRHGTAQAGKWSKATAGAYGTAQTGYSSTSIAGYFGKAVTEDWGIAITGDDGKAIAGDHGKATAGLYGLATVGDSGMATVEDGGTATARDDGTAQAGEWGTACVGDRGTARAGYEGKAQAGVAGVAFAGNQGMAVVGDGGMAQTGHHGKAAAGDGGRIAIEWYDSKVDRYRLLVGYIGEDGLKPNTLYEVGDEGNFVPVRPNILPEDVWDDADKIKLTQEEIDEVRTASEELAQLFHPRVSRRSNLTIG